MLEITVRHFLQREPHVFETDFLSDNIEGHRRKAVVHRPHHPREYGSVTYTGVKYADCRWARMKVDQFHRHPLCHHALFGTRVDEHQVLLPVIEKAKVAIAWPGSRSGLSGHRSRRSRRPTARLAAEQNLAPGAFARSGVGRDEGPDALDCRRRDTAAFTQPVDKFAVVDRMAAKGRFRDTPLSLQ